MMVQHGEVWGNVLLLQQLVIWRIFAYESLWDALPFAVIIRATCNGEILSCACTKASSA